VKVALTEATPFDSVALPRFVEPSWKVTVPVAVAGVTTARSVTGFPVVPGLGDALNEVVVAAFVTVVVKGSDVLVEYFTSPL